MKYIIEYDKFHDFSRFLFEEMKESRNDELKDNDWWKGYSTACERIEENFRAWRNNECNYKSILSSDEKIVKVDAKHGLISKIKNIIFD